MTGIWRIAALVPKEAAPATEEALSPFADAITAFEQEGRPGAPWLVEAYAAGQPDPDAVSAALASVAEAFGVRAPDVLIDPLPDTDWLAENRKSFQPIRAGRFFLYPSHFDGRVPASAIAFRIDASVAFGTGAHETTKGCLLEISTLARARGRRVRRALDMGTGTGVLAMAMARRFPRAVAARRRVLAIDIDRLSVAVARDNAADNRTGRRVRARHADASRGPAARRSGPYDLVVANTLAGPLRGMAPDLAASLAPGGVAVLSGLLLHQERAVVTAHRRQGLALLRRRRIGQWSVLVLRKGC